MLLETNKDKGRAGLSLAIAYYGTQGYTISLPLNDTQWYDLVIEKDGVFQTVQCKFTASQDGAVKLTSSGGTKGKVYDKLLEHSIDILFCADAKMNMYSIPVQDLKLAGNINSITLRTFPNSNNQGFQTYKYLVQF